MALPELAGWLTESLRVTFFANEPIAAAGKNWWQIATGSIPEIVTTRQNLSEHSESGAFGSGQLEMKVVFNRVDWLYTPSIPTVPSFPTLGAADDIFDSLSEPLSNWFSANKTQYLRLAYGPTVLRPVQDIPDGNRAVMSYLPFLKIDPLAAREVFLQINFPRNSKSVENLQINRIAKFMSAAAQVLNIGPGQIAPTIQTSYFCRAELDFNTAMDRTEPIHPDQYLPLVRELAAACRETMSSGVSP